MDIIDVSKRIAGARGTGDKPTSASQIGAVAASDSAGGMVDVYIEGVPVTVATNVSVKSGQSVTVTVVNHTPTVTGVVGWGDQVAVKIGEIAAEVAYIDQAYIQELVANNITAASIVAASAYVGLLEAGEVTADKLNAAVAEIGKLDADEINAAVAKLGTLDADEINAAVAKVDLLDAEAITAAVAKIGELDVEQLEAVVVKVGTLDAEAINAAVAKVGQLETDKLDADMANIDTANISQAYIEWLSAGYAHIANGIIDNAKIKFANVQDVEIKSAMIDVAEIRDMLVKSGIVGEFVAESGKVTGVLDAVRINADAIKAGTLSVDRLLLRGRDGLFYVINSTTEGVTAEQLATDEYQNAMHGDNIVASSITADKISVGDLVAFGATIGGLVIEDGCLRSFAKTSAASESAGFYLGADGSVNFGGGGNHVKYDATTKSLDIKASAVMIGTSSAATRDEVEAKADEAVTAVAGVEDRVTAAESSINQQADRITANVTETTGLKTRMSTVEQTATSLTSRVTGTEGDISTLQQTSAGFSVSIKTANDNANTAKSAATAASSTASSAVSTANTAKSTADAASTKATTAASDASTAKSTASAASSTANTAKTTADAASSTASAANSTAAAAKSAAATAQTTANTAKTNAATAQTTANNAVAAAANAAKTASNYMEYTSAGLDVGNKTSGAWSGFRSRMAAGAFQVLDAAGRVLSSFAATTANIGKWLASTKVGDVAKITLMEGSAAFELVVGGTRDLLRIISGDIQINAQSVNLNGVDGSYINGTRISGDGYWLYTAAGAFGELCTNQSASYPVYGARILYDNGSGNTGTVTVNEALSNFKYVEVYFGKPEGSSWVISCTKVHSPNGRRITLMTSQIASDNNTRQILTRSYSLSGTAVAPIAPGRYYNLNANSYGDDGSNVRVYRIVGYR